MTLIRPLKKGFKQMIAEANATIETISIRDAMALIGDASVLFLDVREAQELAAGAAPGALHVPRGFLEFYADPESPMHKHELANADRIVVYCASGGRSTLACKTLVEMGYDKILNLAGGIAAWKAANGPVTTV